MPLSTATEPVSDDFYISYNIWNSAFVFRPTHATIGWPCTYKNTGQCESSLKL